MAYRIRYSFLSEHRWTALAIDELRHLQLRSATAAPPATPSPESFSTS
jgi:hypothetical protein